MRSPPLPVCVMFTQQPTFPEQKPQPVLEKLGHSGSSEIPVECDARWPQTLYLWTSSVNGLCMVNLHGSGLFHGAVGPVMSVRRLGGDEWGGVMLQLQPLAFPKRHET